MSTSGFTNNVPNDYKVRVTFKGFIIAEVNHGASLATIGALHPDISLCHRPKIQILKLFPDPQGPGRIEVVNAPINLAQDLSLTVSGNPSGRIEKFQQDGDPFNRFDEVHNDKRDFRWFGNLTEMHGRTTVNVNKTKLSPKLTLNVGVFHTSARSDGEAKIVSTAGRPIFFGKFALEIAARVVLKTGETATLQNGGMALVPPVSVSKTDNFLLNIIFDCNCYIDDDNPVSDFDLVYRGGVIDNIPAPQQIQIQQDKPGHPFNPEVYCTGGFFP